MWDYLILNINSIKNYFQNNVRISIKLSESTKLFFLIKSSVLLLISETYFKSIEYIQNCTNNLYYWLNPWSSYCKKGKEHLRRPNTITQTFKLEQSSPHSIRKLEHPIPTDPLIHARTMLKMFALERSDRSRRKEEAPFLSPRRLSQSPFLPIPFFIPRGPLTSKQAVQRSGLRLPSADNNMSQTSAKESGTTMASLKVFPRDCPEENLVPR